MVPANLDAVFLRSGKVKDIYSLSDGSLLFHFTDRVSAFDVILPTKIPRKGEVLCRFAEYWFRSLGVKNHMLRVEGRDMMVVSRLNLVPVECVVRGYLYGSLYERVKKGEVPFKGEPVLASRLPGPIFDPTTKSETKDVPITREEIVSRGYLSPEELRWVEGKSVDIYSRMAERAERVGFIMADLKLEFAKDAAGEILLADSIGPDEFRLWPKERYEMGRSQESFDKQVIRDWLIETGYKKKLDDSRKAGLPTPSPPELPEELVRETISRYIQAYERLTGQRLD